MLGSFFFEFSQIITPLYKIVFIISKFSSFMEVIQDFLLTNYIKISLYELEFMFTFYAPNELFFLLFASKLLFSPN